MLNRAIRTTLRFSHLPKDSRIGALQDLPSSFIFRNAGDSCRLRRIQVEMPSSTIDSRNGMRQPQTSNWSPVK
ncbi:hypothetical protein D3C84_645680 [compost metagenome]